MSFVIRKIFLFATFFALVTARADVQPAAVPTIPTAEFSDAIMAAPADIAEMQAWAAAAFTGAAPADPGRVDLVVLRQDHSVLGYGQSCIDTPIRIGAREFQHGLGTHAFSEISVQIPDGAKSFHALVGVDNNDDTQGARGSVKFSIESDGKVLAFTPTVHAGDDPVAIDLDLAPEIRRIILIADCTEDGVGYDQADWADARFIMADGAVRWLDDHQTAVLPSNAQLPFSFVCGGKSSRELLRDWKREATTRQNDDRTVTTTTWTDPATGLKVSAIVTTYTQYPAVDWLLTFENTGAQDSPLLENVQALDVQLRTGYARRPTLLHELEGDACGENTFRPKTTTIGPKEIVDRAPTGGRPSSISAFPWFNVQYGNRGIITTIGWTGQWASQLNRSETGPTQLRAGMQLTHLVLHPGEVIRTPRIVMLAWEGDRDRAQNQFRRLVLYKYVPKIDAKPVRLPIALQTFDRYNARPGWATEAGQIQAATTANTLGCDTYWFDAAWFPGNFPNGVGNWYAKPAEFPNGLKPVGDYCRANNMRFVLWFEPERVAPKSQIAEEHPEFVLGGKNGGLFNLGDPAARRWLTDLLNKRIDEYGITVYRNDFNMDPLDYWRKNDPPDRQGISEIRYVEGLYTMWDELREKHPGLWIDNCSSGGRRIDIEMCSRSVPLWRSDTNCSAGHPDWNQFQSATLSQYVPLHTACVWMPNAYEARSAATGGLLCQFPYLENNFDAESAKRLTAEARANQPYWYGDFYALTPPSIAPEAFVAYQLHRPDLNAGIVLAFRHRDCGFLGLILGLHGLAPGARYRVDFIDDAGVVTTQEMDGKTLSSDLPLRLPEKFTSMVVRYTKVGE